MRAAGRAGEKDLAMIGFPLLLVPLAIYNILVFLMPGVVVTAPVFSLALPSGAVWSLGFSEILIALALVLLIAEMARAARPGQKSLFDHALALIVFGAALAQFLLLEAFATATFFILVMIAGVDFLGSIAVQAQRAAALKAVLAGPAAPGVAVPAPAHEHDFDPYHAGVSTASDFASAEVETPPEAMPREPRFELPAPSRTGGDQP